MKASSLSLLFFLSFIPCFAQTSKSTIRNEFSQDGSGLMYSDSDMKQLRKIVDSLNLRFKSCVLNQSYFSLPQTNVYYVFFKSKKNSLTDIIKSIDRNEDYFSIIKKYNSLVSRKDTARLIIEKTHWEDGKAKKYYLEGTAGEGYTTIFSDLPLRENLTKSRWVYDYEKKDEYSDSYTLTARFFKKDFSKTKIPDEYARLIQYVDCMVDTSTTIFTSDKIFSGWMIEDENNPYFNLKELSDYLNKKMGVPPPPTPLKILSAEQISFCIEKLSGDSLFKEILGKTIDDYVKNNAYYLALESIAFEVGLINKALLMKRSYRIMGSCSQDPRPREHAREIAILAAQACNWEIFLRAHLDIMNDRFERITDGSYAYSQRKTYLKELEELNLNIVDLLLGLSLYAENLSPNHYYGTVWRIGWALTESKEKDRFENSAIQLIKDDRLDEFNRGLIFLLFSSYLSRLEDNSLIEKKIKALKSDVFSFPNFIQPHILSLKVPKVH